MLVVLVLVEVLVLVLVLVEVVVAKWSASFYCTNNMNFNPAEVYSVLNGYLQ